MLILEGEKNPEENPRSTRKINYGNSTHMKHPSRLGYRFFTYNMLILDGEKNPEENPRSTREDQLRKLNSHEIPQQTWLRFFSGENACMLPNQRFFIFFLYLNGSV